MLRLGRSRAILTQSPAIRPLITCCVSWSRSSGPWQLFPPLSSSSLFPSLSATNCQASFQSHLECLISMGKHFRNLRCWLNTFCQEKGNWSYSLIEATRHCSGPGECGGLEFSGQDHRSRNAANEGSPGLLAKPTKALVNCRLWP